MRRILEPELSEKAELPAVVPEPSPVPVVVAEPPPPRRVRHPSDALRCILGLCALTTVLSLAFIAKDTVSGIQSDVTAGTHSIPGSLVSLAATFGGIVVLALVGAFAAERLIRREVVRVLTGVLAAIITTLVCVAAGEWIRLAAHHRIPRELLHLPAGATYFEPGLTILGASLSFITASRITKWSRWRAWLWTLIVLDIIALFAADRITPVPLLATFTMAYAVGAGVLYSVGRPNSRPPGEAVVDALHRVGLEVTSLRRLPVDPDGGRAYAANLPGGARLDVVVLDRDQLDAGLAYRLWRRVRLNQEARSRAWRSLRRELEREALMAYASSAAGARTPHLLATSDMGSDAALLAYEHVPGVTLDRLPDDELTDEVLVNVWRQLSLLQAQRIAHRRLTGSSILVEATGDVRLENIRGGEIAAGELLLRIDVAQFLTYSALRVGAERAVRAAAKVLKVETLSGALPLLQPIALSRSTRAELRHHKELLPALREQIVALKPQAEVQPVNLERLRPRTIFTVVAGTLAVYVLLTQITKVDLAKTLTSADWAWTAVGLAGAVTSYIAAAYMLLGFVPERLPLGRTVLAQLAGSFVKLVAPAAVSGVAVNTRYLQRAGVPPGPAVASVGASQLTGLGMHILLILLLGYISGVSATPSVGISHTLIAIVIIGMAAVLVVLLINPLRRSVLQRLRQLAEGVVPRLLDVLHSPRKLAEGLGGTLMVSVSFVTCLDACIRAFGGHLGFAEIAVVFLAGNALGSAAPTPGGLGAVEGALSIGLTLTGLPSQTATSAVLLFRLLTFWLPVLPGWAAFAYLQRRNAL